jgi:hypothetical protein
MIAVGLTFESRWAAQSPIGLEFRREGVEANPPSKDLLVGPDDQNEGVQQRQSNPHASQIDDRLLNGGDACPLY